MGLENTCTLREGRKPVPVRVHLDSDRLEIRGGARRDILFKAVESAAAMPDGTLQLKHPGGPTVLRFADAKTAAKWAEKIRSPKTLVDKLGLKPGLRVAVLGITDQDFLAQAAARLGGGLAMKPGSGLDLVFHAADSAAELAELADLKACLQPAGAIWVVSLKGQAAKIKDTDVMRAARAAGLVDNKVCSFSATHTALRLVIPRAAREAGKSK
ncbi:MAG TPA: DUF3052 family protein [Lacunisphaera sp.]|nr:DUF3052 family protein [Lacunisphaera sp.]